MAASSIQSTLEKAAAAPELKDALAAHKGSFIQLNSGRELVPDTVAFELRKLKADGALDMQSLFWTTKDGKKLLQKIGEGGMATVYRGRHTTLLRDVAIKVLHPHLSASPRNRKRFAREARAIEQAVHDKRSKLAGAVSVQLFKDVCVNKGHIVVGKGVREDASGSLHVSSFCERSFQKAKQ